MRTPRLLVGSLVALAACSRGGVGADQRGGDHGAGGPAAAASDAGAQGPAWLEALLDGAAGAPETVSDAGRRRAARDVAPAWSVVSARGALAMDSTERARVGDGAGGLLRPGADPPGLHAAAAGRGLFPGDRLETGEGEATIRAQDGGLVARLGPRARVVIPPFGASELLVSRGVVVLRAGGGDAGPALRRSVDAPGARVRLRAGSALLAVADGAQTLVVALDAPADVYAPLVLPHVVTPDAGASLARPLPRTTLAAGHALAFDAAGRLGGPGPVPTTESGAVAWRAHLDAEVAGPGGHLLAVRDMARAGGQDLADARALLPELRSLLARGPEAVRGAEGLEDERDALENQLAAALGRAAARADRGRALAARGGDVGALFNLAELESVEALARAVLPLPVLDSPERARVP